MTSWKHTDGMLYLLSIEMSPPARDPFHEERITQPASRLGLHPRKTVGCNNLSYPNFHGGFVETVFDLRHEWIITSNRKLYTWLFIHLSTWLALCCVLLWLVACRFYPYPPGLLHWPQNSETSALIQVKQIWRIWTIKSRWSIAVKSLI